MIFIIPGHQTWAIFPILHDESPGRVLRSERQTAINPGNYLVLDDGKHAKSRDTELFNIH
jgi:hypothetical protein